jgi:retron-type reverse transcriptase
MQYETTVPTFEDKVLQRAVAMVLEGECTGQPLSRERSHIPGADAVQIAVYEQSFLDCSYGFRPGRSAHQALRVVQSQTVMMAGRWVLEVDIRNFLDPPS